MINVVIVDDLATVREMMKMVLETDPEIKVIGMARGGKEAIDIIPKLKPDIVLMDLRMPDMDGFQTVRHIMGYFPTRILIITASHSPRSSLVFQAIESGALDLMAKPPLHLMDKPEMAKEIISRIKTLSKATLQLRKEDIKLKYHLDFAALINKENYLEKVIAIAVSTGGPKALKEILPLFPANFPAGMIIVQHISQGFVYGLVDWLQGLCKIKIRVANNNDIISKGEVLFAPDTSHIIINTKGKIQYEDSPPLSGIRPAADILFPTIAKFYGKRVIGVIMTGMSDDGVRGIEYIKKEGGTTIAQDEKSCAVFGMPKAAIERGVIDKIVPLSEIPDTIIKLL